MALNVLPRGTLAFLIALLLQDELERMILSARDLLLMSPGKSAQNSAVENGDVSTAMKWQGRRGEIKEHHEEVMELDGSNPKMESSGSCNTSLGSEKLQVVSCHLLAQKDSQSLPGPHGLLKPSCRSRNLLLLRMCILEIPWSIDQAAVQAQAVLSSGKNQTSSTRS